MRAILDVVSPAATLVEALEPIRSDPAHGAVLLDIDGTLVDSNEAHVAAWVEARKRGGFMDRDLKGALAIYDDPADLLAQYDESPFGVHADGSNGREKWAENNKSGKAPNA